MFTPAPRLAQSSDHSPLYVGPSNGSTSVSAAPQSVFSDGPKRYLPGYIAAPAKPAFDPRSPARTITSTAGNASPFRHGSRSPETRRGTPAYVRSPAYVASPYRKISMGGMTPRNSGLVTENRRKEYEEEAPPTLGLEDEVSHELASPKATAYDSPMSTSSVEYGLPSPSNADFMPRPKVRQSPRPKVATTSIVIFGAPLTELRNQVLPQLQKTLPVESEAFLNARPLTENSVEIELRGSQEIVAQLLRQSGELVIGGWTIGIRAVQIATEEDKAASSYSALRSSQSTLALDHGIKRSTGSTSVHRQSVILPQEMAFKKQKVSHATQQLILPDEYPSKGILTRLGDIVFGW